MDPVPPAVPVQTAAGAASESQDGPGGPTLGTPPSLLDAADRDVACPLCDYNLRGLTEPRCPECGYKFAWRDLLDPGRKVHPYLFEHYPRRNVWSFRRTIVGGLRPWKFWSTLRPDQPSRPDRLKAYWVVAMFLVLLVLGTAVVGLWVGDTARYNTDVKAGSIWIISPTPQGYFDTFALRGVAHACAPVLAAWAATCLAWPWLTLLILMIFRVSMRKARVRTVHVLRTVLYSSDVMLWGAAGLAVWSWSAAAAAGAEWKTFSSWTTFHRGWDEWAVLLLMGSTIFGVLKLCAAYQKYLRFDHAWATVIASQVILFLAALAVAANVAYYTGQ